MEAENDELLDIPIVEHRGPRVGTFWINNGEIVSIMQEANNAPLVETNVRGLPHHLAAWSNVEEGHGWSTAGNELSRGQVLYDIANCKFVIAMPLSFSNDKKVLFAVMRKFSLPPKMTIVQTYTNYRG